MLRLVLSVALANSPFVVPPPATTAQADAALGSCGPGDTTCLDKNGVIGAPASGTTDPLGVMLRGKQCSASDGSCTPANVVIAGGMSVIDIQIDGADPSVSCAGNNDTITMTIKNSNDTAVISAVPVTVTDAVASVATTCSAFAALIDAACIVSSVAYCDAVCSSPEIQITLTPAASAMTALSESTAGCTTVSTLSYGSIKFVGNLQPMVMGAAATAASNRYCLDADCTTYLMATADNIVDMYAGGLQVQRWTSTSASVIAASLILNNGTFYATSGVTYIGNNAGADVAATGAPTGSIVSRGVFMLPRINSASITELDACDANNVNGSVIYVEDTNDTAAGQLCVCANTGDATWDWLNILAAGIPCTLI